MKKEVLNKMNRHLQIACESVDWVLDKGYESFSIGMLPAEWGEAGGVKPFFKQLETELKVELIDNLIKYKDHIVLTDFMQCNVDRAYYEHFVRNVKARNREIYQSEGKALEYLATVCSVIDNVSYNLLEYLDFDESEYSCIAFNILEDEIEKEEKKEQMSLYDRPFSDLSNDEKRLYFENKFSITDIVDRLSNSSDIAGSIRFVAEQLQEVETWEAVNAKHLPLYVLSGGLGEAIKIYKDWCKNKLNYLKETFEPETGTVPTTGGTATLMWKAPDIDLLELCVALMESNSVARADGAPLTRKELVAAFEQFLGMNAIKDPDKKLNQAKARKKENTGFLKKLAAAFENWRVRG